MEVSTGLSADEVLMNDLTESVYKSRWAVLAPNRCDKQVQMVDKEPMQIVDNKQEKMTDSWPLQVTDSEELQAMIEGGVVHITDVGQIVAGGSAEIAVDGQITNEGSVHSADGTLTDTPQQQITKVRIISPSQVNSVTGESVEISVEVKVFP